MNLANKITIARICLIPLFIIAMQPYPLWMTKHLEILNILNHYGIYVGTSIFIIASATDKLDGYIARKYNQITNIGKLLDPLADKLLISVALIMLVNQHMISSWVAIIIIGREIAITGIRIMASAKRIALAADRYGKWKMVLQVVAIAAVLMNNYPFTVFTEIPVDMILMFGAVILTIYSGYNYVKTNYKTLQLNT
jgi:CDP-diacylglycerol--glycerol-3-phosphate 3-phosphatidyltransferase